MLKKIKVAAILSLVLLGCKENCGECFTPPMPLIFEFVDQKTGENLFANGTYKPEQLEVLDASNGSNIDYVFLNEQDLKLNSFGWKTETIEYNLYISDNLIFSLNVKTERVKDNCCDFTRYNQILIQGSDYQLNQESGIYQILL